jgi:hypothetical protein
MALHHNSGSYITECSSLLNKLLLLVVTCNFGAKPRQIISRNCHFVKTVANTPGFVV